MLFLLRILYALSVLRIVVAHNYTLHHRFLPIPPIGSIPAFQPRGIVSLPEDGLGSASFAELHGGEISDDGNGWYQVTFQTGDEEDDWPLSSIKSCHIASTSHVHLTIHMTSSQPSAISLHSSSDSCPPKSVTTSLSPLEIIIKHPTKPQSPMLSPPPSIDHSTGQAITPPPEKSFLQKYWLPILGIAIFAMAQMGPDQPQDKAK